MKNREYRFDVNASFVVTASSQEEAESKAQAVKTQLEWTLNNVEVEFQDSSEPEPFTDK